MRKIDINRELKSIREQIHREQIHRKYWMTAFSNITTHTNARSIYNKIATILNGFPNA